jgi:hypothetical protein
MGDVIRSFWIEGELTRHQLLTVRSFLSHGHGFELYTYEPPAGLPPEVKVRDLHDFVPRTEVFHYKRLGHERRLGGISERVKAELLFHLGGWHVDMDVTCLRPFDMTAEFVLRPHQRLVVANIIKCPAGSELARIYRDGTLRIDAENADWEKSFLGLAEGVRTLGLERFIVDDSFFGRDDGDWPQFLTAGGGSPDSNRYAVHWCGTFGRHHAAQPGSFYDSLMVSYGLA